MEIAMDTDNLNRIAKKLRATCVQMAFDARESHLSSALSCIDILISLFSGHLKLDKNTPDALNRDRFIMSKGHGCSALYAVLAQFGYVPVEWLKTYSEYKSPFPNHPCVHALPLLEMSSGSLGHGLGIATGIVYALKYKQSQGRSIVLLGDGECNEGSIWEAAMFAKAHNMNNLLAIVDNNGSQAVGKYDELNGFTRLEDKFSAFGWHVETVDGHNFTDMITLLKRFPFSDDRPSAVIAKTVSGAGVSFMENDQVWFYRSPSAEDLENALNELQEKPIYC